MRITTNNVIIILALNFLIFSCSKVETEESTDSTMGDRAKELTTRKAITYIDGTEPELYPPREGRIVRYGHGDNTIIATNYNGLNIIDYDIVLTEKQIKDITSPERGGAGVTITRLWPNKTIYYTIDKNVIAENVREAISRWEDKTDIKFVENKNNEHKDFVEFVIGDWYTSYVGKKGRKQTITLGEKCKVGYIMHEIGHAIGLWHEHANSNEILS